MNKNKKNTATVELFLPSLKSNIERDPVFHNVRMLLVI
jgi:hypothetical protein